MLIGGLCFIRHCTLDEDFKLMPFPANVLLALELVGGSLQAVHSPHQRVVSTKVVWPWYPAISVLRPFSTIKIQVL